MDLKHELTFTNFPMRLASWLCCEGLILRTVQIIIQFT